MAEQLGATTVINGAKEDTVVRCQQFSGDMGADIVFETAGSAITVKQAPYLVMRGGKIMIVGTVLVIQRLISSKLTVKCLFRPFSVMPTATRSRLKPSPQGVLM